MSTSSWGDEADDGFQQVGAHHGRGGGQTRDGGSAFHGSDSHGEGGRYGSRGGRGDYRGGDYRGGRGGGRGGFHQQRQENPIPSEPPYTLFVGALPMGMTQGDLDEMFQDLPIKSSKLIHDRETGKFKGFALVEFEDVKALEEALHLEINLDGRQVRLSVANKPGERREGGYSSRGGRGGGFSDRGDRGGRFDRDDRDRGRGGFDRGDHRSDDRDRGRGGFDRGGDREDYFRRNRPDDSGKPASASSEPPKSDAPSGPPRLKLMQRTVAAPIGEKAVVTGKSDPFAGAKPRDDRAAHPKDEKP